MVNTFEYDVFVSYSSRDREAARELATRLRADGLRVWFDEWEIMPGDPILRKIEQGLERSRVLLLVMSAHAFGSEWVTLERQTALFRDPTNVQRRFIPLRLDDAEIPTILKQFRYVDWRERSGAEYDRLLAVCRPGASGRKSEERREREPADGVWRCPSSTARAAFVGSNRSDKFHRSSCPWVEMIRDDYRICFASRGAAVDYGYAPCKICRP